MVKEYVIIVVLLITIVILSLCLAQKSYAHKKLLKQSLMQHKKDLIWIDVSMYHSEKADDANEKRLLEELKNLFEQEKIYLDKALSIKSLSMLLGTNKTVLSKVINKYMNMSFPALVQSYRIKEAVNMLRDDVNDIYTLEYLSDKCGYSSRQVFHSAFKREVGVTPKKFRSLMEHIPQNVKKNNEEDK